MNELNGYDIEDLEPGMTATFSKTITDADIVLFAGASGDNNAIHINDEFCQNHTVQWPDRAWFSYRKHYLRGDCQQTARARNNLYLAGDEFCGTCASRRHSSR
tara:strand:+ start:219 stop:527 length:309 start_codon:yes stop_codon:yes gene_type:complete